MRILIGLLALMLGACAQAPYTAAPAISKLDIGPVKTGNSAISDGNKKIGQSAQNLQTKLQTTREKLDAAIIAAHQQREQNAQLDQTLQDASKSLNEAITENTSLRMTTFNQQGMIDKQTETINQLAENNEVRQKIIDAQTAELTQQRADNANFKAQQKLDQRWWGIGYFIHGAKYLGWRLLILLVVLGAVIFVINLFVPAFAPIFQAIIRFLISLPGRIARFIVGLFRRKPPS